MCGNRRNYCCHQSRHHHQSCCHPDFYRPQCGCQDNFKPHYNPSGYECHGHSEQKHHSHHAAEKCGTPAHKIREIEGLKSHIAALAKEISSLKDQLDQISDKE